jgi:hypothetical protein
MADLADRYLLRRRNMDEEKALRRVGATTADLRVWRREPAFREKERAAIAAPPRKSRVIDLNKVALGIPDERAQEVARLRRLKAAGQASPDDLRRLEELERRGPR